MNGYIGPVESSVTSPSPLTATTVHLPAICTVQDMGMGRESFPLLRIIVQHVIILSLLFVFSVYILEKIKRQHDNHSSHH